jgi:hypothetical protein
MIFLIENIQEKTFCVNKNQKTKRIKKAKKVKKNKYKKNKKSSNNIFSLNTLTPDIVENTLQKTVIEINPSEVYKTGMTIIENTKGDSESKNSMQIGNYFIEPEDSISFSSAEEIINKINYILPLTLFNTLNKDFNLNIAVITLNEDSEYQTIFKQNKELIKDAITQSSFYFQENENKDFIKRVLLLALKTILEGKKDKGFFSKILDTFSSDFVDQFHKIIKNNNLIKEIELINNLKIESGKSHLHVIELYVLAYIAYFIEKKDKVSFLESPFFDTLVHAITIPVDTSFIDDKISKINLEAHKTMLTNYQYMLDLYNIKYIDGITQTNSGLLSIESTFARTAKRAAKTLAIIGGGVITAAAINSGRHLYNREEVDKDKPYLDTIKEGFKDDASNIKTKFNNTINKFFSNPINNNIESNEKEEIKTKTEEIKEAIKEAEEIKEEENKKTKKELIDEIKEEIKEEIEEKTNEEKTAEIIKILDEVKTTNKTNETKENKPWVHKGPLKRNYESVKEEFVAPKWKKFKEAWRNFWTSNKTEPFAPFKNVIR